MQTLYTLATLEDNVKPGEPQKLLQKHFDQSKDLLQYFLYFLSEVASYAETDSYNRSSKHLPSAEDLNVNTKIAGNELLWKIKEDIAIKHEWAVSKPDLRIDKELVKRLYIQLADSEQYKRYISTQARDAAGEREILEYILEQVLLTSEAFISHLEENYSNWDDDGEMIVQMVKGYLQKPGAYDIGQFISGDKLQFARTLLSTVQE
jgi:transcription antitermination protein NusB